MATYYIFRVITLLSSLFILHLFAYFFFIYCDKTLIFSIYEWAFFILPTNHSNFLSALHKTLISLEWYTVPVFFKSTPALHLTQKGINSSSQEVKCRTLELRVKVLISATIASTLDSLTEKRSFFNYKISNVKWRRKGDKMPLQNYPATIFATLHYLLPCSRCLGSNISQKNPFHVIKCYLFRIKKHDPI